MVEEAAELLGFGIYCPGLGECVGGGYEIFDFDVAEVERGLFAGENAEAEAADRDEERLPAGVEEAVVGDLREAEEHYEEGQQEGDHIGEGDDIAGNLGGAFGSLLSLRSQL